MHSEFSSLIHIRSGIFGSLNPIKGQALNGFMLKCNTNPTPPEKIHLIRWFGGPIKSPPRSKYGSVIEKPE